MIFFEQEFLEFFKGLRANNNRDWFQEHKSEYEKHVKKPFQDFVAYMINFLHPEIPEMLITPKDAIFRIYRDVRFSKDKTPYKEHVSAAISPGGRKDMGYTGLYIQIDDKELRAYSGFYQPQKHHLEGIRYKIAGEPQKFKKLYTAKAFVDTFGEIRGEKNKRLPKELNNAADSEPLIYNKAFYYYTSLPSSEILKEGLPAKLLDIYQIAKPLNQFLFDARD